MESLTTIQHKILDICDQKVILDRELAAMYGVETKVLNQAVKRNIERFPIDFMFQLDVQEVESLRSQIVTSNFLEEGAGGFFLFRKTGGAKSSAVADTVYSGKSAGRGRM